MLPTMTAAPATAVAPLSLADEELYGVFWRTALYDLGRDMSNGFLSAYFRTFAVPSGAQALIKRGGIMKDPRKRATDTRIVV